MGGKVGPEREKYALSRDEQTQLEKEIDAGAVLKALKEDKILPKDATWKSVPFYHPKESAGCPSGYSGRVGIHEVLPVTATVKELMMKPDAGSAIEKQARSEGMLTMSEDGIFKAAQGITTIEEVLRVVTE